MYQILNNNHQRRNESVPIVFFLNLVLLVAAGSLIGVGTGILSDESKGIDRFTSTSLGAFALTMGIITILLILLGAYTDEPTFSCLRVIIFILLIILGSLALAAVSNNDGDVHHVVKKVFEEYVNDQNDNDKRMVVDTIQQNFKCCGVEGPHYWISSGFEKYPFSCYESIFDKNTLYENGCVSVFQKTIIPKIIAVAVISITWGFVEVSDLK
ncbi:hypothetical protein Zmor_025824 [Zophobas morio]|uniref:Tetraspanin n=1 Tax=Zophobas morio TaxID=2755281 RepID=A0AA38M4L5_9CUCU|nr:hypothetical protein Zmor_025824 [Zophobas morio]